MENQTDILCLSREEIEIYQQNRPPYLFLDRADAVVPGVSATGYKRLDEHEWFFKCHFPNDPNMPGLLQVEALQQLASLIILTLPGNKGKVLYLSSANRLKFTRKVLPGDKLSMQTAVISWKRGIGVFSGKGWVDGQLASEAEFVLVLPDALDQFRVKVD